MSQIPPTQRSGPFPAPDLPPGPQGYSPTGPRGATDQPRQPSQTDPLAGQPIGSGYQHCPSLVVYVDPAGVENIAIRCSKRSVPGDRYDVLWVFDPELGMVCYREVPFADSRQPGGHFWQWPGGSRPA